MKDRTPVKTLTRQQAIDKLVEEYNWSFFENCGLDARKHWLTEIWRDGCTGFNQMSNKKLETKWALVFDFEKIQILEVAKHPPKEVIQILEVAKHPLEEVKK